MEKARLKQIKRLEKLERIAKQRRLEEERERQRLVEQKGIIVNVDIKRISVAGSVTENYLTSGYDKDGIYIIREPLVFHLDENILEGIFQHEGNWYPAYLRKNTLTMINFRCSLDALAAMLHTMLRRAFRLTKGMICYFRGLHQLPDNDRKNLFHNIACLEYEVLSAVRCQHEPQMRDVNNDIWSGVDRYN